MTGLLAHSRMRAATGLIAAYAIALQTLFAAFAPLPANAQAGDFAGWHVFCFGSGNTAPTDDGDPDAPPPASGKYHCILCGTMAAVAAILPEAVAALARHDAVSILVFAPEPDFVPARYAARAGSARAPPLTV